MAARKPTRERLGAFSDGAIAIIITIMVLELKPPHHAGLNAVLNCGRRSSATHSAICLSEYSGRIIITY